MSHPYEENEDEKKGEGYVDAYATVLPAGDDDKDEGLSYQNIPEGVDPKYVREEKVVRGLSQRHIQVSRVGGTV
jgi:hypothetical protein